MKLIILGNEASTGASEIGCMCPACAPTDLRNNHLRVSSLLHADGATILIDCSPGSRAQILRASIYEQIGGVSITHEYYGHTGRLDDLCPLCHFSEIPIYSDAYAATHLRVRVPHHLMNKRYPEMLRIYLRGVEASRPFFTRQTEILPVAVIHGRLPIFGYCTGGRLGYVTGMLTIPDASYEQLQGLDVLVVNALRSQPHSTYQSISKIPAAAGRAGAEEAYLVRMSHHVGLHAEIDSRSPPHVRLAYDGIEIDF